MSKCTWKLRYAIEFRKRTGFKLYECWEAAGAMLEDCLDGNTDEMTPKEAVLEELSCWND